MHDLDRTLQGLEPEGEFGAGEYELSPEIFGGARGALQRLGDPPLSEEAETDLAHELLGVTNEAELEQYMGNFMTRFPSSRWRHRGRHRIRRHFRRYVDYGPPPLPPPAIVEADPDADDGGGEEMELEGARRWVRLAAAIARKAAGTPPDGSPGAGGAGASHPPPGPAGQPDSPGRPGDHPPAQTGRWVRDGSNNNIILLGAGT
jgi:hypothetical protein